MRKLFLLIAILGLLFLSSCTSKNAIEKAILKKSGIYEAEEYQTYQRLKAEKKLDENGEYAVPEIEEDAAAIPEGAVRITFGENPFLLVQYFKESSLSEELDTNCCYLNPGDNIFAVAEADNPNTGCYEPYSFRIRMFNNMGDCIATEESVWTESQPIFTLPKNADIVGLAILPIGRYTPRELNLRAYYFNHETGEIEELPAAGTWTVCGKEADTSHAEVDPVESYTVRYDYDENYFFFVSSTPSAFFEPDRETGYVEFIDQKPEDGENRFEVELHHYLSLKIKLEEGGTISFNGEEQNVKKGKTWEYGKFVFGDGIEIETEGNLKILEGDYQYCYVDKTKLNDKKYRYVIHISEKYFGNLNDQLGDIEVKHKCHVMLDDEWKYGVCSFKIKNELVSGETDIWEGNTLTIICELTDKTVVFSDKNWLGRLTEKNKKTVKVEITSALDGETIRADDYVVVRNKGE